MSVTKKHQQYLERQRAALAMRPAKIADVARRFTSSCMSDAKWHRAFAALNGAGCSLAACRWKFVDSERIWKTEVPKPHQLEDSYYDGSYGLMAFNEIEWLDIVTDKPEELQAAISRHGQFATQVVDGCLRIYGYQ